MALGIGATTAIFSVADAVLFRPLPYPKSDRLVTVRDELSKMGVHFTDVSVETFEAYQKVQAFDATAAFTEEDRNLIGTGGAEWVSVLSSTPGLFEILGARLAIGRLFAPQDWDSSHSNVAILGHSLFARRFGAAPSTLGRTIRLDGRLYTVVGVMASSFNFAMGSKETDVWIPLPNMRDPAVWQFRMIARMRPGIGVEAAQASINAAARHVDETVRPYRGPNGEDGGYQARVTSLRNRLLGDFRSGTLLLLSAVSLLLLVACVNVASLLIARASSREKETAIRHALGASGFRLLRQWLTEAGVLVTMGGAAGLAMSWWGVLLLKSVSPAELPGAATVGIDFRAVLFALTISSLVSVCLSLAPALTIQSNINLRGPSRRRRLANILVAAEVAIALVLLAGCGLLAKSLFRLRQIDPGLRVDHVLTMRIQLSGSGYQNAKQRVRYFSELADRLAKLPGVVSVSEVDRLPVFKVGEDTRGGNPFSTDGHPWNPNAATQQMAHTMTIGTGYFRTMQIPLRQGRDFSQSDNLDAPPVAIVNETLAHRFFPENQAMGRRILFGAPEPGARWMTIIGIIGEVRTGALDLPPAPQFYMPHPQNANGRMFVVIRTARDPREMNRIALATARELDPEQPVYEMSTLEQHVEGTMGQPRFRAMLLSFFALAALFLAAVGIYGVVTTAAVQRTKEIGIRVAVGADAAQIVATILAHGLQPVAVGIAIGIAGALFFARLLSSVLYAVKPDDSATFAWAVLLLAAIATIACLAPALRAARLDPLEALRED